MFGKLRNIVDSIANLDQDKILFEVWKDDNVEEFIINLNTMKQLFEKGIDSKNRSLGEYADLTIANKKALGLPFDRITLYDTGEFYESFQVVPIRGGFEIIADPFKEDTDLTQVYGYAILGLTAESKELLTNFVVKHLLDEIRYRLLHV